MVTHERAKIPCLWCGELFTPGAFAYFCSQACCEAWTGWEVEPRSTNGAPVYQRSPEDMIE